MMSKIIRVITLVEEKRTGKLKGRTVADGRKQRLYIHEKDATSPTVSLESLLITSVIDAYEGRTVYTADISGVFLHSNMDETVILLFEREQVDLILQLDPEYKKYFHTDGRGNRRIYVKLCKAMYGCMRAAILFWKNTSSYLCDELGFILNEYDMCVANKVINGKQCTICWESQIPYLDCTGSKKCTFVG